jgi:hypothetical protein
MIPQAGESVYVGAQDLHRTSLRRKLRKFESRNSRASELRPTQEQAIEEAKRMFPRALIYVERVRNGNRLAR